MCIPPILVTKWSLKTAGVLVIFSLLYDLVQRGGASLGVWVEYGCTSVYSVCDMCELYSECDIYGWQGAIKMELILAILL